MLVHLIVSQESVYQIGARSLEGSKLAGCKNSHHQKFVGLCLRFELKEILHQAHQRVKAGSNSWWKLTE